MLINRFNHCIYIFLIYYCLFYPKIYLYNHCIYIYISCCFLTNWQHLKICTNAILTTDHYLLNINTININNECFISFNVFLKRIIFNFIYHLHTSIFTIPNLTLLRAREMHFSTYAHLFLLKNKLLFYPISVQ